MHSKLSLSTLAQGNRTILQSSFASPPLKLMSLPYESDGILRVVQMSSSPGLLGGDTVDIEIKLSPHTALSLYTQSFTRILEMDEGKRAQQHTHITQQAGSSLCYLPHPLVLHTGSTLVQTTEIELDDDCDLIYGEIVAAGRIRNGESFKFNRFSSHLLIRHGKKKLVADNIQWQPATHPPSALGQMEHYTHQLNLFYVNTAYSPLDIRIQVDRLYEAINSSRHAENILWGVSQAAGSVLCLRALADNAYSLQRMLKTAATLLHPAQSSPLSAAFFK